MVLNALDGYFGLLVLHSCLLLVALALLLLTVVALQLADILRCMRVRTVVCQHLD